MRAAPSLGTGLLVVALLVSIPAHLAVAPQKATKTNVSSGQADSAMSSASSDVGLGPTTSLGNDPCTMGRGGPSSGSSGISIKDPAAATGMPTKPQGNVGKGSQMADGSDTGSVELSDPKTDASVGEISQNSSGNSMTVTCSSQSSQTVVELDNGSALRVDSNSQATVQSSNQGAASKALGRVWILTQQAALKVFGPPRSDSSTKVSWAGVRGNCDPYGVAGGCQVGKGHAGVIPASLDPVGRLQAAERQGLIVKAKISKVNPGPDGAATGGRQPAKTIPGDQVKEGINREIASKTNKAGQVTNPRDDAGGGSTAGFDMCGHHLPTVEEFARMKIDPNRIINPADTKWTGRIDNKLGDRTLTWSTSTTRPDGMTVKVQRSFRDGALVSASYEYFNRQGVKVGTTQFDAKTSTVVAERLK